MEQLEKRVSELEKKLNEKAVKKERKPREKSEYNLFVKKYISDQKKKNSTKTHQELFKEAAGEWSSSKKSEK